MKILMGPDTHGVKNLSINMVIIPPGSKSDTHIHESSEEYWIVVDGRGEIVVNEEKVAIEPGMIIYAAPKSVHCIVNTGNEPLKAYFLFAPPGPEKALLEIMKKGKG
jgi:mannose-6-phosphate isomerase-like protein (cupin superfamily)